MSANLHAIDRDLQEAQTALQEWWRLQDPDESQAALHTAGEAMLRGLSAMRNAIDELYVWHNALRGRVDANEIRQDRSYADSSRGSWRLG